MLDFAGYNIPDHTQGIIRNYIVHGYDPGDFVYSVMSNNLFSAVGTADNLNIVALPEIVKWVYNKAPDACHGSEAKVIKWMSDTKKSIA